MIIDKSKKIHEQISPETWCQGALFMDANGVKQLANGDEVVSGCAAGWSVGRYGVQSPEHCKLCLHTNGQLSRLNDTKGFDYIKALFVELDL